MIKIAVLGAGAVGKSAVVIRMVANEWKHEYDPTIGGAFVLCKFSIIAMT